MRNVLCFFPVRKRLETIGGELRQCTVLVHCSLHRVRELVKAVSELAVCRQVSMEEDERETVEAAAGTRYLCDKSNHRKRKAAAQCMFTTCRRGCGRGRVKIADEIEDKTYSSLSVVTPEGVFFCPFLFHPSENALTVALFKGHLSREVVNNVPALYHMMTSDDGVDRPGRFSNQKQPQFFHRQHQNQHRQTWQHPHQGTLLPRPRW